MLVLSALVPGHPMFIPEIAGKHLTEMEVGVNVLMKLALKIQTAAPESLIFCTPGVPVLHHRFSLSKAVYAMRVFESNRREGEIVELQFPGGSGVAQELGDALVAEKLPVEYLEPQGEAGAIDNTSLSMLYYLHKAGYTGEVVFLGMSDMSPEKHKHVGKALARYAQLQEKPMGIIFPGSVVTSDEVGRNMAAQVQKGTFVYEPEYCSLEEYMTSGQEWFFPLMILEGVHGEHPLGAYHHLGTQRYDEHVYLGGYWGN